jgi:RNA polymerase sigma-70 factor (ECF subfamily)
MPGSESAKEGRPYKEREAEERRLVEAAQRDTTRFGDVYEHYFEIVYPYVARRVGNRTEAEDVTAEVFRKALQSLPRFKWTGAPFAAWLFRIASNIIADRAKRAAREVNIPGDEDLPDARVPQSQQADLEQSERSAGVSRMVNELAEDQRRVLVMRFAEERSLREIAQTLGRSEGAIKQLQFRALQNLRAKLIGGE